MTASIPSNNLHDVLVVGGGPCGLAAAVNLGRCGVRTLLVEKHPSTSYHPRGHVVNARTMEILRSWGLEAEVRARGIPQDRNRGVAFVRTLAGEQIGRIETAGRRAGEPVFDAYGPSAKTSCPQDVFEPVLRRAAESQQHVELRFGTQVGELVQDSDGVEATLIGPDGAGTVVRASYVIAADGARGSMRERIGIRSAGEEQLGNQIGVYFEADLWPWIAERPNLLWWVYNTDTVGVLIALDGRLRWTYNFGYDPAQSTPEDFTPEKCAALVRAAVGVPDLKLKVCDVRVWQMQARVAESLRAGRVFLAGDAAHPLPPTGGQGMNTAIGDVHNLCWKLALVTQGTAGDALLDTYEAERLPVIRFNVEQSVRNARRMEASGLGGILKTHKDFREEDVSRMRDAIPQQREHFDYPGQTYGYTYRSESIFDEGESRGPCEINTYLPSAVPGGRAPHCWLVQENGATLSTIDLFRDQRFTLLAGRDGGAWTRAFRKAAGAFELDGRAYLVGERGDLCDHQGAFHELYGIGARGAVLVRPDGHVAWRAKEGSLAPDEEITVVLRAIVDGKRPPRAKPRVAGMAAPAAATRSLS